LSTDSLLDRLRWRELPIPGTAARGGLALHIGEAGAGGPVALVTAGVHGDEGPWGAWAIHTLLASLRPDDLLGTLRVIPVANPLAMEADLRNAPVDQLDLNRAFPGNATGSYTERVAAAIVAEALPGADVVIDLHGGGSWCVNAFAFAMPDGEALTRAFDPPFIVKAPDRTVTLTGYARSQGAAVVAVEMGGRSQYEADWAGHLARGLRRALVHAGVVAAPRDDPPSRFAAVPVGETTVLRPSLGGVFMPELGAEHVGTVVAGGTTLGRLLHPVTGVTLETFAAPFARTALLLLRPGLARVEGGAMTYVIAEAP
jgi:hypothetical protein